MKRGNKKEDKSNSLKFFLDPLFLFAAFILFNLLKTTLFYNFMTSGATMNVFIFNLITAFLFVIVFYYLAMVVSKKIGRGFFVFVYIAQLFYMAVNLLYFIYFKDYLYIKSAASMIFEGLESAKSGTVHFYPILLILIIDLPMLVIMLRNMKKIDLKKAFKIFLITALASIIFAATFYSVSFNKYENLSSSSYYQYKTHYGSPMFARNFGVLALQLTDFFDNSQNAGSLAPSKIQLNLAGKPEKSNIIFIQVETLDANAIFAEYNGKPVMPYFRELAFKSIYYPYTLSYHYTGTADSEFVAINSVEPLTSYPAIKLRDYDYPNSLVKPFKNESYSTLAFHGNVGDFYNRETAFYKMGFDHFYDIKEMNLSNKGWGAADHDVYEFALNKIDNRPFFFYIITMSSHEPFTNVYKYYPDKYGNIHDENLRNYFNSMSYVDESIRKFVNELDEKGVLDNTYIIIDGDHSISSNYADFGSNTFRSANFDINGSGKFEIVPTFIITPDGQSYLEENKAASFLDFAPTILSLSGVQAEYNTSGQNLADFQIKESNLNYRGNKNYSREFLYSKSKSTMLDSAYMHDFIEDYKKAGITGKVIASGEDMSLLEALIDWIKSLFYLYVI